MRTATSPRACNVSISVLAVTALSLWGCSGSSAPGAEAGAGSGGTGGGAMAGAGGSATGGAGGASDAGSDTGAPPATGRFNAKFCNPLVAGVAMMSITLTASVGQPPIQLMAASGQCSSPVGQPCTSLPAGAVEVTLREGAALIDAGTFNIVADTEIIFFADVDTLNRVTVEGLVIQPGLRCATLDPFALVDGGASAPGDARVNGN